MHRLNTLEIERNEDRGDNGNLIKIRRVELRE